MRNDFEIVSSDRNTETLAKDGFGLVTLGQGLSHKHACVTKTIGKEEIERSAPNSNRGQLSWGRKQNCDHFTRAQQY